VDHAARELLARWDARFPSKRALADDLLARYAEPHRVYHTTDHLRDVCAKLDWLTSTEDRNDTVELAAWFHDAVYEIGRDDNEERSAELARTRLRNHGFGDATADEVARLVLLTADHAADSTDRAGSLLCDADLAILAADRDTYDRYAAQVRAEYSSLDRTAFDAGRAKVLESLIALPRLFKSSRAKAWEAPARHNLQRELNALRA
jgi:predicted metal-dependent HD superfamily phosphohydrolase